MADAGQVFGGGGEFQGQHPFGNQLGSIGADDMDPQDAIRLGVRQHFYETAGFPHAQSPAIGQEGDFADLVGHAFRLELLFGLAHPGNFRVGVDDRGNGGEIHVTGLSGHGFRHGNPFFHGLVGQHGSGHYVADGPHAGQIGPVMGIHRHPAPVVQLQAHLVSAQAVRVGNTANGNDQPFRVQGLGLAVLVRVGNCHALLAGLDVADLDAHLEVHALLGEQLQGFLSHVLVSHGQEIRSHFQHRDFGTQTAPHGAHFQANHSGADDG